jgi:hypothetical protein
LTSRRLVSRAYRSSEAGNQLVVPLCRAA